MNFKAKNISVYFHNKSTLKKYLIENNFEDKFCLFNLQINLIYRLSIKGKPAYKDLREAIQSGKFTQILPRHDNCTMNRITFNCKNIVF